MSNGKPQTETPEHWLQEQARILIDRAIAGVKKRIKPVNDGHGDPNSLKYSGWFVYGKQIRLSGTKEAMIHTLAGDVLALHCVHEILFDDDVDVLNRASEQEKVDGLKTQHKPLLGEYLRRFSMK